VSSVWWDIQACTAEVDGISSTVLIYHCEQHAVQVRMGHTVTITNHLLSHAFQRNSHDVPVTLGYTLLFKVPVMAVSL
jgi:hypothetical protein